MELARALERRLERLVDGLAGRLFRGTLAPVELANRLVREADLAVYDGEAGPAVPNRYQLRLNPAEMPGHADAGTLERELAHVVAETAAQHGWRLDGPAAVELVADPDTPPGRLHCATAVAPGHLPPWAHLNDPARSRHLPLRHNREVLGRSQDADINIPDSQVSRFHALLWRESGGVWVIDLESRNGTLVNGVPALDPTPLAAGDVLKLGPVTFVYSG